LPPAVLDPIFRKASEASRFGFSSDDINAKSSQQSKKLEPTRPTPNIKGDVDDGDDEGGDDVDGGVDVDDDDGSDNDGSDNDGSDNDGSDNNGSDNNGSDNNGSDDNGGGGHNGSDDDMYADANLNGEIGK
jgi:hypothetical protein